MPSSTVIGLDVAGLIRDVIEQGTHSGDFRLLDPDKAMTFVGQQLYGAMSVRAGDPEPAPLDEAADELCTFLLYGLAGPARARAHPGRRLTRRSAACRSGAGCDGGRRARAGARTMVAMRRRRRRSPRPAPAAAVREASGADLTVIAVPFYFATHGGGVPLAAPPRRATGPDAPGTTRSATPWPAWPWAWGAWWRRSWGPSC